MSEAATEPERRPRLNPFAFPSDTAFRFGLLVAAVLGANLYVWQWIASTTRRSEEVAGVSDCLQISPVHATSTEQFAAATDAFSACVDAALPLPGLVDARRHGRAPPRRRRDHARGSTLDHAPAQAAPAHGSRCAGRGRGGRGARTRTGPRPAPPLLEPARRVGRRPRLRTPGSLQHRVGGGLVVKQAADPPAFRAVVRHELAHIRNRDVGITYFTIAVWYAFLLVAVLPFLVTLLDDSDTLTNVTARLAVLALLVYLTRNAVLRSREVYADLRASVPDGPAGALRRVLEGLPRRSADPLSRLRSVHPDPRRRLAALDDTRPLFPLGAVVAFAAGLTATIAFDSVVTAALELRQRPLRPALPGRTRPRPARGRRRRRRDLAGGVRSPRGGPRARVAVGRRPRPRRRVRARARARARPDRHRPGRDNPPPELDSLDGLVWAGVLVAGLVLIVAWFRTSASWWLRALGGRRPRARADRGPARRRRSAHPVHGHLHDGPRAAGRAWRSRARRRPSSTSRSTRRSGPSRSGSGSSCWTASCS